jgi:hypothetical protein
MKRIRVSKNFYADEFISEQQYLALLRAGREDIIRLIIDSRILAATQYERDLFGPTYINTWFNKYDGGKRQWSGVRLPNSPYFSDYSMHSHRCLAVDTISPRVSAEEKREHIRKNYAKWREFGITRIESRIAVRDSRNRIIRYDLPTWLHKDVGFTGMANLREITV